MRGTLVREKAVHIATRLGIEDFKAYKGWIDRLCSLVIRVSDYRSRGMRFDSCPYQIFWEVGGLERGPLSLVRTTEELLEWKITSSGLEHRD
jgi:hypothetical protein